MRIPLRFRQLLALLAVACTMAAHAQSVGISANGATPNTNAILDIDAASLATKRGLLIPRITEAQRLAIPVTAADNALLVYQTDIGAALDTSNARGFWYYDATAVPAAWVHLAQVRRAWTTQGNNVAIITGSLAEFLGSMNGSTNRNLVFRTNPVGNPAIQMGYAVSNYQSGFVGLGTPAPAVERLEVNGAIHFDINKTTNLAPPLEGTIRYGTKDGLAPSATNPKFHWGTLDTTNTLYWARLENAENYITPPQPYPKDTLICSGATGDAFRGSLSTPPVTQTLASPANVYSPFATNSSSGSQENFRVQYMYRNSELVKAGICFPATITAFAFYALDPENIVSSPATTISGEIRGGPPGDGAIILQGVGPYFGVNNTVPFMDEVTRTSGVKGNFNALTTTNGWVNFPLIIPITLGVGQHLILDIVWTRNTSAGAGPKVELENTGFNCTKWVINTFAGGSQDATTRGLMDDGPTPTGGIVTPIAINPHQQRPVTRFSANISSRATTPASANYVQYDGGLMIGSAAWLAGAAFQGPGTIKVERGVYDAGLLLSDHVFDQYFDGAPQAQDAEAAKGYAYVGLDQLRQRLQTDRHLPNMPSRSQWEASGGASLGTIATGLWETVEDQALYITQLEQDLGTLEDLQFGNNLQPAEAQRLIAEINASKRLSQAQKLHLVDAVLLKAKAQNAKP